MKLKVMSMKLLKTDFKIGVKIGDRIFQLIFDTEEYKNQLPLGYAKRNLNEAKADNIIINNDLKNFKGDIEEYKNENKKSTSVGYAKRNLNKTEVDNIIINDDLKNFKSDTEEYKNNKSSLSDYANKRSLEKPNEDTDIINDNSKNFNPKTVHLYNTLDNKY